MVREEYRLSTQKSEAQGEEKATQLMVTTAELERLKYIAKAHRDGVLIHKDEYMRAIDWLWGTLNRGLR